jgi:lysozyme
VQEILKQVDVLNGHIENFLAQLKEHEGFRSKPYKCTAGKLTIGYGLNLEQGITEEEAAAILAIRCEKIEDELVARCPAYAAIVETDAPRAAVLLNMAYNLGVSGLLKFRRTLSFVEAGHYDSAATEMLDSTWAKQVGMRAIKLSEQMRIGEWSK